MEAAITEITLEPSLSACTIKQKGEGGGGVGWDWLPFAAGLAIWLANLPLLTRVQTTLLAGAQCVTLVVTRLKTRKKNFFDIDIVVKQMECGLELSV